MLCAGAKIVSDRRCPQYSLQVHPHALMLFLLPHLDRLPPRPLNLPRLLQGLVLLHPAFTTLQIPAKHPPPLRVATQPWRPVADERRPGLAHPAADHPRSSSAPRAGRHPTPRPQPLGPCADRSTLPHPPPGARMCCSEAEPTSLDARRAARAPGMPRRAALGRRSGTRRAVPRRPRVTQPRLIRTDSAIAAAAGAGRQPGCGDGAVPVRAAPRRTGSYPRPVDRSVGKRRSQHLPACGLVGGLTRFAMQQGLSCFRHLSFGENHLFLDLVFVHVSIGS